jgi:outer membrane protein assembly factor BamD (BamD/ComL family)
MSIAINQRHPAGVPQRYGLKQTARGTKMKRLCLIALLLTVVLLACSDQKAQEWYDTAQLEELQNSPDRARELYQRIVDEYPDNSLSEKATERLAAIDAARAAAAGQ